MKNNKRKPAPAPTTDEAPDRPPVELISSKDVPRHFAESIGAALCIDHMNSETIYVRGKIGHLDLMLCIDVDSAYLSDNSNKRRRVKVTVCRNSPA